MNQRLVAIAVWSLALLFALACVAFAWRATRLGAPLAPAPAAEAAPGAAVWGSACARCHEPGEFTGRLAGAGRAAAVAGMLARLDDHGALGFAEDLQVIQWLATQAGTDAAVPPTPSPEPEAEDDFSL